MQITLIRHTSVVVPKGICYGVTEVPLSATFDQEKGLLREKLSNVSFDAIYSSPLSRCTLLATGLFPETDFVIDHRLSELNFGDWELIGWDTIFATKKGKEWFADYVNTRCLNGESFAEMMEKCRSFLNDLQQKPFQEVAIITHTGVIRAFLCILQEISPKDTFYVPIDYGQIIKLTVKTS
jgi:alpha-ribazole phosphatase